MRRSTWGVVALIAFACGGKTEVLDDGLDSGAPGASGRGTSGGTPGVGGASGSGAASGRSGSAGVGGTSGRGGSAGLAGGSGIGGSAGIPGTGGVPGSGGAVTGGAGGVGGSADQLIDAICKHYEAHGCGVEGCQADLKTRFDINEQWGCGDEWLTTESCMLSDPTPCGGGREVCSEGLAILQRCIDEAEICIRGNHMSGGCVMGCETWTADCLQSNAGLHCTCTIGTRAGAHFDTSAPCQSDEWLRIVRATCQ